jgi:hypothetical protein
MTNTEWDAIFNQLRSPLKQAFEDIAERNFNVTNGSIGHVTREVQPGLSIRTGLVFFIALEAPAAVMRSAVEGVEKMTAITQQQLQDAIENQPRIIEPGANKSPFGAH